MVVLFLSPNYPPEMRAFARGLREVGATVLGVGDTPTAALSPDLRGALSDYLEVPSSLDEDDVIARLEAWAPARAVERVETNWEPTIILAARLRERWGLPGMRRDAVIGFRDKVTMRERLAAAGVRVPKTRRAEGADGVRGAALAIGLPVIVKPVAGAGSADTWSARDEAELDARLRDLSQDAEMSVEERIEGVEHTHETISVDGVPVIEGCTRYYPNVLDARKNEWISPIILSLRDLGHGPVRRAVEMGHTALRALGMGTGFTHMEWFLTPEGEVVFGELACRSPGANMVDLMNYARDVDLYREWARAVVHGAVVHEAAGVAGSERPRAERRGAAPTPKYHAAIVFKRAEGQGRIRDIVGLREFIDRHGPHIARVDFLPVGAPRRDWRRTFLSDGNLVVRHPDEAAALAMAREAADTIRVYAG